MSQVLQLLVHRFYFFTVTEIIVIPSHNLCLLSLFIFVHITHVLLIPYLYPSHCALYSSVVPLCESNDTAKRLAVLGCGLA
jgi:hypothetical protein